MKRALFTFLILVGGITLSHAQIDYPTQIQPILTNSCNSCHNVGQNTFNSSSYAAVMASRSASNRYNKNHVIAGDPNGSPLVDKLNPNPDHGNRMPNNNGIPQDQINLIINWIAEGANATATNNEVESGTPTEFKLLGNYPNPFNPSTTIEFQAPETAQYSLSIYTVHGQLISEEIGRTITGSNTINVDLSARPTGVYIYQLKALINGSNQLIGSGNMTLIK